MEKEKEITGKIQTKLKYYEQYYSNKINASYQGYYELIICAFIWANVNCKYSYILLKSNGIGCGYKYEKCLLL